MRGTITEPGLNDLLMWKNTMRMPPRSLAKATNLDGAKLDIAQLLLERTLIVRTDLTHDIVPPCKTERTNSQRFSQRTSAVKKCQLIYTLLLCIRADKTNEFHKTNLSAILLGSVWQKILHNQIVFLKQIPLPFLRSHLNRDKIIKRSDRS